jgi:hypothetical protein
LAGRNSSICGSGDEQAFLGRMIVRSQDETDNAELGTKLRENSASHENKSLAKFLRR